MASRRQLVWTALVGLSVLLGSVLPHPAFCQEGTSRKMLYVFSLDFPPDVVAHYPTPPLQQTRFWQLLDREIQATNNLSLTTDQELADYRVELRCTGLFPCSQLAVDVKDPQRNTLTSFNLKKFSPFFGLWKKPDLEKVARELAILLDERIRLLSQGGVGYYD
jgi:hypothetical protein